MVCLSLNTEAAGRPSQSFFMGNFTVLYLTVIYLPDCVAQDIKDFTPLSANRGPAARAPSEADQISRGESWWMGNLGISNSLGFSATVMLRTRARTCTLCQQGTLQQTDAVLAILT